MNDAASAPRGTWIRTPWILGLAILGVYAVSLGGPWLEYDDDWLVRDNELLNSADLAVLVRVLFGFDRETRLVLGAEYLPVRDLVTWIGRGWLGLDVLGFRLLNLAVYGTACITLLAWGERVSSPQAPTEPAAVASAGVASAVVASTAPRRAPLALAVWLFALHPVHVESVAWIGGLKDVLALLFVALALLFHARGSARDRGLALVCVFLACASKSVAVVSPVLFLLIDLARRRPVDPIVGGGASVICVAWAALHAWVGSVVGMYAEPLGDDPITRLGSVAVLFARYVGLSIGAHPHSVIYDVEVHGLDLVSLLALAGLVTAVVVVVVLWRRDHRWPAIALAWFVVALLPTSQILAPLQNRMADRYLLLAVLAPCSLTALLLDASARRLSPKLAVVVVIASLTVLGGLTALRAHTFASPVALFMEATQLTTRDTNAPSLLGRALMNEQEYFDAELAYRDAIARDGFRTDHGRRDGNSLGQLLAGLGRAEEARDVFATLVERYPADPRVLHNLAVMEEQLGLTDDAARHREALAHRFPDYRSGVPDRPGPL